MSPLRPSLTQLGHPLPCWAAGFDSGQLTWFAVPYSLKCLAFQRCSHFRTSRTIILLKSLWWGDDTKMRAIFAIGAGIALLVVANSAHADEAATVDWTGPYLGLHGGVRRSQIDAPFFSPLPSGSPVIWGGQFGYDWQYGKWVLGFESDLDAGKQSKSESSRLSPVSACTVGPHPVCPPLIIFQTDNGIDAGSTVSVRARAGFAAGRWLLYGTGGLALAHARARHKLTVTEYDLAGNVAVFRSSSARRGDNLVGWTLGLGGEVPLDRKVSIAVEYRHSDFGSKTVTFDSTTLEPFQVALTEALTDDPVTLRLNYRF